MGRRATSGFYSKAIPTLAFCVIGSYGLSRMVNGGLEVRGKRTKSRTERQYELEEELEVVMKDLHGFDSYENKPVPSPSTKKETSS